MTLKKSFFFCFSLAILSTMQAQEVITGMYENPVIRHYQAQFSYPMLRTQKSTAVKMPFIDDFSRNFVYPDSLLWEDIYVYVNDGYGIGTPTIGCATFDAYDQFGHIYEDASTFPFIADYLTSHPIRLDSIFIGTPHVATPADSVYLSFFFQPQGLGEKPDDEDSLMVQFYNPIADEWITVWSFGGMSFQNFVDSVGVAFLHVMIPVKNPDFFSNQFRFRFCNYATIANNAFPTWAGNVDHWNVDYVYLNSGRSVSDTLPVDVAFNNRIHTLLNDFHSMPWSHFLVNPTGNMVSSVAVPYTNYSSVLLNLTERLIVTDLSGSTAGYNSGISASNLDPFADTVFYRLPFPYTFNSLLTENADFLVQFCINSATIPDMERFNDTVAFIQRFYNYFRYDDASPEAGYALMGVNAQLAYKFTLSHADTLRAVQIQFNRVYNDVNEDLYFNLRVWNDQSGKPGSLIYEQQGLRPYMGDMYQFHNYVLDEPLPVSGTIYVGWKQQDSQALNIGYDRNTNRQNKIFYNTDGQWYGSMYEGALMMRILVGDTTEPYVNIFNPADDPQWKIQPNPAFTSEGFSLTSVAEGEYQISIYTLDGRLLFSEEYRGQKISIPLESGVYIVSLTDVWGYSSNRKLIILQ
jgi:hypothetical protein